MILILKSLFQEKSVVIIEKRGNKKNHLMNLYNSLANTLTIYTVTLVTLILSLKKAINFILAFAKA